MFQALGDQLRLQLSKMLSLGAPRIYDVPIIQAIFEGNVIQLTELMTQREEVNAQVMKDKLSNYTCTCTCM